MSKKANHRVIVALTAALVFTLIPVAVSAVGGTFTDDDASVFEPDIEWLAASGVTKGCNPPANDLFCPGDNVSRGQMAAFLRRFAQFLGAEDGQVSRADHAVAADSASSADQLDGMDPSAFDTFIVGDAESGSDFTPYATISDSTQTKLAEASFVAPAAGAMAVTGTVSFQHAGSGSNFVDLAIYAQLDDTTCVFANKIPTAYGIASAAPPATEPLWNSVSFTTSVDLSAGAHTLTLCGFDASGDDAALLASGITAVVSPSSNSTTGATVSAVVSSNESAGSR